MVKVAKDAEVTIRLPYVDYHDPGIVFEDESLAQQCFADECDLNAVIQKWLNTGVLEHVNTMQQVFEDVSETVDYHTALNIVNDAHEAFMDLPAKIRDRFDNDPAKLLNFLEKEENRAEAESLGLVERRAAVDRDPRIAGEGGDEPPAQKSKAPAAPEKSDAP